MTQPLGMEDFFSLEAGEYLERLAALVAGTAAPSAEEIVRFTRALRGSALMANQAPIARAASGLEHLLRGYRDGRRPWDPELGTLVREAVGSLRELVKRVPGWTPDDTARAERLAIQLESSAGGARPITAPMPALNEAGVRAFLAREAAAVASVLDQAARTLGNAPTTDVGQAILRRMQPLRGLAAISDYPPLPDVLDGVERTVGALARLELAPAPAVALLDAAATALGRAARDIADRGRPEAEAGEFRRFADLLLAPAAGEAPIVPIEALFFAGEDGIIERRSLQRAALGAGMAQATVVSRGEHLRQAADELARAASTAQHDLRLHTLVADLRTLAQDLPAGLDRAVEAFASAARAAVSRGAAGAAPARFVELLLQGGEFLRGFDEQSDPLALAARFDQPIAALDMLGAPLLTPPEPAITPVAPAPEALAGIVPIEALAPEPRASEIVPIDSLAPEGSASLEDESDVVPIESLLMDEPVGVPTPAPAPRPSPPATAARGSLLAPVPSAIANGDGWDLAASFTHYEQLLAGISAPSVTVAVPPPAPRGGPRPLEAGPSRAEPPRAEPPSHEPPVLEIAALLYRGRTAVTRAAEVRRELDLILGGHSAAPLQPLVDELADLVELAFTD